MTEKRKATTKHIPNSQLSELGSGRVFPLVQDGAFGMHRPLFKLLKNGTVIIQAWNLRSPAALQGYGNLQMRLNVLRRGHFSRPVSSHNFPRTSQTYTVRLNLTMTIKILDLLIQVCSISINSRGVHSFGPIAIVSSKHTVTIHITCR